MVRQRDEKRGNCLQFTNLSSHWCLRWLHHSSLSLDLASKNQQLPPLHVSLINSNAVGKTSLRQQQNYFHITRHLRPNCCLNNAEQMSPRLPQIQPMDAALLAAVKSRGDDYHPVVSTSPLLYLAHPSSQPLRRPLTLTLPCPPNPEKKRRTREQRDEQDHRTRPISASPPWDQPAPHRRRWVKWGLFVFDVFEDLEESSSSNGMKNVCHH